MTRLSSEQRTWFHLQGLGSDQPRDSVGFRLFLRAVIAGASGLSSWGSTEWKIEKMAKMRKCLFTKWVFFFSIEIEKESVREMKMGRRWIKAELRTLMEKKKKKKVEGERERERVRE